MVLILQIWAKLVCKFKIMVDNKKRLLLKTWQGALAPSYDNRILKKTNRVIDNRPLLRTKKTIPTPWINMDNEYNNERIYEVAGIKVNQQVKNEFDEFVRYSDEEYDRHLSTLVLAMNGWDMLNKQISSYMLWSFFAWNWEKQTFWVDHKFTTKVKNSNDYKIWLDWLKSEIKWVKTKDELNKKIENYSKNWIGFYGSRFWDLKYAFGLAWTNINYSINDNWRVRLYIKLNDTYDFHFTDDKWNRFTEGSKLNPLTLKKLSEAGLYMQENDKWKPYDWSMFIIEDL